MQLPSVIQAEYRGEYRILVRFNDGVESIINFSQWLDGPIFEPLKDHAFFQRFFIEGGTIGWPNGADVAPETLYEQAKSVGPPNKALQPTGSAERQR